MLFLEMAPPFVVVVVIVKFYIAFCAIDVITTFSVVQSSESKI